MRWKFLKSGVGAVLVYVLAVLVLAATLAPWAWRGGMWLDALVQRGDYAPAIEWLGEKCGSSADNFGRYFSRMMVLSLVLLLPLLLWRMRVLGEGGLGGLRKRSWARGLGEFSTGFLAAAGVVGVLVAGLALAHVSVADGKWKAAEVGRALLTGLGAGVVEEWVFRGLILGIWLRHSRVWVACVGCSVLFAFLHFLSPSSKSLMLSHGHALAGFELMGAVLRQYADLRFFTVDFVTLVAVGLVLARARVRTAGLWFPIGIHVGWVVAYQAFGDLYERSPNAAVSRWFIGDSLRSGLFPLLAVGLTALLLEWLWRRSEGRKLTRA